MRALFVSITAGLLLLQHAGAAQTLGEICVPDPDAPVRPGITCQATDDFDYQLPYVANAKKGDILLSAGCGMIGGLLRQVSPAQRFSHSGLMIDNWTRLRHSTAAEARYPRDADGDGLVPENLKYGWPGVITETIDEAYEGHHLVDPEGEAFFLQSFNRNPVSCPEDVAALFPSVVKPPFETEQQLVPRTSLTVRQTLEGIAEAAKNIHGHYRFYAYSDADIVGNTFGPGAQATSDAPWAQANAPDGTVCSQLIWSAAQKAGVQVEDSVVEPGDKPHVPNTAKNGIYIYSSAERLAAGEWLYDLIYDQFYEESGWWGRLLTDAPDDGANQITNCFAFDWCGSEPGMEFDGEPDAKDSERWRDPGPSLGTAVSPDNLTQWDLPPGGVYGLTETLAYRPGEYVRIHRWTASADSGPVTVTVRFNNAPAAGALVTLLGFRPQVTDAGGIARFVAIPGGRYSVQGIKNVVLNGVPQDVTASGTVTVTAVQGGTVTLNLTGTPPPPPDSTRAHRRVTLTGTVFIKDHENFGSNETDTHTISGSVVLDPVGKRQHTFTFSHCTGDEVRVETSVLVSLNPSDRSVTAEIRGKMFEGDDCRTNEQEDEETGGFTAGENSFSSGTVHLVNGYAFGDDEARINVTLNNQRN
ncbi:MAG TPA: carboxypeptidase-like regulatory domain-containing protein [Thermoanaerobaculia bacterium]|nr:carboxypeptidase-like regulatory domain-containing protein [Thermoanaerobaculia bacterium]